MLSNDSRDIYNYAVCDLKMRIGYTYLRDIGFLLHICTHYVDLWFILYIVIVRFLLLSRIYYFILRRYITKNITNSNSYG